MSAIKQLSHQVFVDAEEDLPDFFLDNLVDPNRVVKCFENDPQANLRIFYYQYLKLCFEIDNVDYESYIDKIYDLIRSEDFCFTFPDDDPNRHEKNVQFKSLMIDFFDIMNSGSLTIDLALTQYPILDQIFTNFFRTISMLAGVAETYDNYIEKRSLFEFLTSYFSVDISSYDKCLKFVQSDIFVYQQDPQHIYMAFIKEDETVNESYENNSSINNENMSSYYSESNNNINSSKKMITSENQIQNYQNQNKNQNKSDNNLNLNVKTKTIIKQSYIQSQFADYTEYNKPNTQFGANNLDSLVKHNMKGSSFQDQSLFNNNNNCAEDNRTTNVQNCSQQTQGNTKEMFFAEDRLQKQLKKSSSGAIKKEMINKEMSMPNFHAKNIQLNADLPTKDPGFQIKVLKVQDPQVLRKKDYVDTPIVSKNTQYFQKHTQLSSNLGKEASSKLITTTNNSYSMNSNFYSAQGAYGIGNNFYSNIVQNKKNTNFQNLKMQQSKKYEQKKPYYEEINYKQKYVPTAPVAPSYKPLIQSVTSKKDKFGLNVTKQFTNSIVMKVMNQPFRSNTYQIREKARMFRKSLYSFMQ